MGVGNAEWCRDNRHLSVEEQHAHLSATMRGHYAYLRGDRKYPAIAALRPLRRAYLEEVASRRDSKRGFNWTAMAALLDRHRLPPPRIIHRYAAV